MSRRIGSGFVHAGHGLALSLGLVSACRPTFEERDGFVDELRVLAVRVDPPEAKPGDSVAVATLIADAAGPKAIAPRLSFCTARRSLDEPSSVSAECRVERASTHVPFAASRSNVPGEACRLFGPDRPIVKAGEPAGRPVDPDGTGGYYQPGLLSAVDLESTIFEVRIRCGLVGATQESVAEFERRYVRNTNPSFALAIVRGEEAQPIASDAEILAAPRERLRIRATWPTCTDEGACEGAERFLSYSQEMRALSTRREAMRLSYFSARGAFVTPRTGRGEEESESESENTWTAPSDGEDWIYVVLRDSRGGSAWKAVRVRVAP